MDVSQIQYATTEDGVSIAYRTIGEGKPALVWMEGLAGQIQMDSQAGEIERAFTRLAERRMVVRFDFRGFGMSQRDVETPSLDAWLLDIRAVVDHLGLAAFALSGSRLTGPVAIAFAASYPDRVSHLFLRTTAARGADFALLLESQEAQQSLRDIDPGAWADLTAFRIGLTDRAEAVRLADFLRESDRPKVFEAALDVIREVDTLNMLPLVTAPTLIFHRQGGPVSVDAARTLAAQIPDAHLFLQERRVAGGVLPSGEQEEFLGRLDDFLADGEDAKATTARPSAADVHTILFTDMASSTSLTQQLGDAAAQEVRRAHNEIVRAALKATDGREIKHTGDGIMASFSTASSALDAAIAIQRGVALHRAENPDSPLAVYVGLNAGEPIAEDDDLFGTSINLAARICDHAEPGQIFASNVVRELAAGKDFLFSDLGETELRGFEDPVKLWELRWQE